MKNLNQAQKHRYGGLTGSFMDLYIRGNKVWSIDQMLEEINKKTKWIYDQYNKSESYIEELKLESKKYTGPGCSNFEVYELAKWMLSGEGQEHTLSRITKKYNKDKELANTISPLVEKLSFGFWWDETSHFEIGFGKIDNKRSDKIKSSDLKKIEYIPWSIEHVEIELGKYYQCNLLDIHSLLCESHIEKQFVAFWQEKFYKNKNNPALIPEVCALKGKFFCYEYDGRTFATCDEIPEEIHRDDVRPKSFRLYFFINNVKKQKNSFIELDGHEFHKTKPQRILDSIKRNHVSSLGIPLNVFTGTQLTQNIEACFQQMGDIFSV
jgi:hypothetical protein